MKFNVNVFDILLLSLAVQGIILSLILIFKSKKIRSNRWIGGFIFVIAQSTIVMELFSSDLVWRYPMLITYTPVLKLWLGPLMYFYSRSLIYGDEKFGTKKALHFLPVLLDMRPLFVQLLYISGFLSIPVITNWYTGAAVQQFLYQYNILFDLPALFSLVIYSVLSFRITVKALKSAEIDTYKGSDLKLLKTFLYLAMGLSVIFAATLIFAVLSNKWNNYPLYIPAVLLIYWLGMRLIFRQSKMTPQDILSYNKPPVRAYFASDEADGYQQKLVSLMEVDELYLDPALKLEHLAAKLGLPEKQLSGLLNQYVGKNFNDFVNEYRVKAVSRQLGSPAAIQYTIAAIAFDCGFNSLATFQRCFKQFMGVTPSQFQKTLKADLVISKVENE